MLPLKYKYWEFAISGVREIVRSELFGVRESWSVPELPKLVSIAPFELYLAIVAVGVFVNKSAVREPS